MNNDKIIITMDKYGDTYKVCIGSMYLDMYINGVYQGGINVRKPNIYEWTTNTIQSWLDEKAYWESKGIADCF